MTESLSLNIAVITNHNQRYSELKSKLKKTRATLRILNFNEIYLDRTALGSFELLILDFHSFANVDLKEIFRLRNKRVYAKTPFLFILNPDQTSLQAEIYADQNSGLLMDPFGEYQLLLQIRQLVSLNQLEKQIYSYDDVLENERKLIHYLDTILQIPALSQSHSTEEFFYLVQTQFSQRMELTFSVETVLFMEYNPESDTLLLVRYGENAGEIKSKVTINLQNSKAKNAFLHNYPIVFENQMLLDSFVQELEEAIGCSINTMIFTPLSLFHQPKGGFALINKLYRKSFSENDLALSLITVQKLVFQLESIYLRSLGMKSFEQLHKSKFKSVERSKDQDIYREIFDSIHFGFMIFDEKFKMTYVNNFARQALGVKAGLNLFLEDTISNDAAQEIKKKINNQELPALRQEMMVNLVTNKPFYMGYSIYRIFDERQPYHYALTFLEISQTKRLQAEIIRMDRLASLGVLASGVAHEIRNPLAGIKAMAQTLKEELHENDSRAEYAERIVRQVNRLDELLKSFFSYAKPNRPDPVPCNIPDIVHEVLPLFNRRIKENKIIVKETYSPDLKEVFVDFHQIEQVIFNLLDNAIETMKEGGILTIYAHLPEDIQPLIDRRRRIPKLFSDVFNEIMISDNGEGMDNNTINNMYNPFFTTKPTGTGLGLSIVYQIIQEHGGQISVDSVKGKGTTFRILLPVYVEKDLPAPEN